MPKLTVITRKAYGGAYIVMASKHIRADFNFAYPTAEIAVMGAEGAANVLYAKEIAKAADPVAKRAEIIGEYNEKFANPYVAAGLGYVDEVIMPRETRKKLLRALTCWRPSANPCRPRSTATSPFSHPRRCHALTGAPAPDGSLRYLFHGDLLFGRDGRLRSGWKVLLFGLGAAVATGLAGTLRASLAPGCRWLPGPWWSGLALLALTGWCLAQEGRPLASVGLALDRRWAIQWTAGVLSGAGLIGLMALASFLGGGFHLVRHPAVGPAALLAGAWLYLAVAVGARSCCSGATLFQRLMRGLGPWPAQPLMAAAVRGHALAATRAWPAPPGPGPA